MNTEILWLHNAGFYGRMYIGVIIGLIPLFMGLMKKHTILALAGFIGAFIGQLILPFWLSIPIAIVYTMAIIFKTTDI